MAPRELEQRVEAARRFNRFYTRQIGVLHEGAYNSPFSLTEVRVLYELAHRDQPTATMLGRDLGLDAGYLSRILRGFERRGLVLKVRSAADGRQSHLSLTAPGRKVFGPLNARSHDEVAAMLGGLSAAAQARVVGAMQTIERLLGDGAESLPPACSGRRCRATWAGWCTGTVPCTLRNTATTNSSRHSSPRSWRTSFSGTTRTASAAGSRSRAASRWARCSWSSDRRPWPSCGCSWWSRRRVARASGPVWWTNACGSRAGPATARSPSGPRASCARPDACTRRRASTSCASSATTASAKTWSRRPGSWSCDVVSAVQGSFFRRGGRLRGASPVLPGRARRLPGTARAHEAARLGRGLRLGTAVAAPGRSVRARSGHGREP